MSNESQFRRIDGRGSTWLTCPVCKKQFNRPNAHLRGKTASCSQACARIIKPKRKKEMINYSCRGCGKAFQKRKGYSGPAIYCSNECRCKHAPPKGANHPRWKGGISKRPHSVRKAIEIRMIEVRFCEKCGVRNNLQGHHKKSYANHPELRSDPSNIEVLCADCHAKEHPSLHGMISRPRIRSGKAISCIVCGTERYVPMYLVKSAKFCGRKCQIHWLNSRRKELRATLVYT